MPRTNLMQKPGHKTDYKALGAKAEYARSYYGVHFEEMAAALGMTLPTFYARLRDPSKFTLGELIKLSAKIHMPLELSFDGLKIIGG